MISVERPTCLTADDLWAVLSDLPRWPDWLPTVDTITPVEAGAPVGVGASYVLDQPGLRRATWTITEWEPGARFTWQSQQAGVVSTGVHELLPVERGATIRLTLDWAGPLAGPVRWFFGARTRDYVTREAEALAATAAARASGA